MTLVHRLFWKRSRPRLVGRGDPFDPRGSQAAQASRRRRGSRQTLVWRPSKRWLLLLPLCLLLAPPLADVAAGMHAASGGECRLLSVVNGNTLLVQCGDPEPSTRPDVSLASIVSPPREIAQPDSVIVVELLGVPSLPILGARCLSEALAGLRAQMALRWHVWFAQDLQFTIRAPANLAMAYVDGHSVNHTLRRTPRDYCAT